MGKNLKTVSVCKTQPNGLVIPQNEPLIKATLVVVRDISHSFDNGLTTQQGLGKPDYDLIRRQQHQFTDALGSLGVRTVRFNADEANPDSQFPRDTVLSYKGTLIGLNPGSDSRRKEVGRNVSDLQNAGLPVEHLTYGDGAYIEGGDILAFESAHLVLIGLSGRKDNIRTNEKGAAALASALRSIDPDVTVIAVPHTGTAQHPEGVLHLETGFTLLTNDIALKDPKCHIMWESAVSILPKSGSVPGFPWQIVDLPESEGYGAHVLPINGGVIIAKGYPTVKQLAEAHYSVVIEVDMSEAQKMDGSLRCWTILHNERA